MRAKPPHVDRPLRSVIAVLITVLTPACAEVDHPYLEPPRPRYNTYVETIQPIVGARCSFLPCHGSKDRALTVYGVGFLRASPLFAGTPLTENALTEDELDWNYDAMRLRLIDTESAGEAHLLLKCLDPDAGGAVHADGYVVFYSDQDPDYIALRDWIATGL